MTEPTRLIEGDGTEFERELLGSVLHEPVPEHLQVQMALGLGLAPVLPPDVGLSTGLGSAAKAQVASGLGWLKMTALSVGLCAAGAAGFGVWHASQPAPSETKASLPGQGTAVAALVVPPAQAELRVVPAAESMPARTGIASAVVEQAAQPASANAVVKVNTRAERTQARGRASDEVAGSASDANFVEQELRLLDPARAALKRGDTKTATRLLDEYDRRFERGALRREANVLRGLTQSK